MFLDIMSVPTCLLFANSWGCCCSQGCHMCKCFPWDLLLIVSVFSPIPVFIHYHRSHLDCPTTWKRPSKKSLKMFVFRYRAILAASSLSFCYVRYSSNNRWWGLSILHLLAKLQWKGEYQTARAVRFIWSIIEMKCAIMQTLWNIQLPFQNRQICIVVSIYICLNHEYSDFDHVIQFSQNGLHIEYCVISLICNALEIHM